MIFKQIRVKELDPLPLGRDPTWAFTQHLKEVCEKRKITRQTLAEFAMIDPAKLIDGNESLTEIHLIHLSRIAKVLALTLRIEAPDSCERRTLTEYESVASVLHYGRRIKLVEPEKVFRE